MEMAVLKQKMGREDALKKANTKGDWLWSILFANKPLSKLELWYFEYQIFEVETVETPSLIQAIRKKKITEENDKPCAKIIEVMVNGSTGGVALVNDTLEIEYMDFDPNTNIQNSVFATDETENRAKKLANKIGHRVMGGMHEASILSKRSVYRPYWVAFYGEVKEGSKVRYITIAADGGKNSRAR